MLSFSFSSFAQMLLLQQMLQLLLQTHAKGKELFNANCAACHKLDGKATGPALRGVADKYDKAWLYKWIRNSSDLIKSGDAKASKSF
jgi:mono/diheme cytochrome c family protein